MGNRASAKAKTYQSGKVKSYPRQPLTQPVLGLTHPPVIVKLTVEDVIRDLVVKKFDETKYQEARGSHTDHEKTNNAED